MESARNFVFTFMIAVSNCSLYSHKHEAFDDLAKKTYSLLNDILDNHFSLMIIDNELIINKVPLREAGIHGVNLIKRLKRKSIARVDILKDVTLSEIKKFIIDIASPRKELSTYSAIRTGDVVLKRKAADTETVGINNGSNHLSQGSEMVKEVFRSAGRFKELKVVGLEALVVNFITTFKKEANILKMLSPVKSFSEYTYTHASNVAVLSMFQAETLGIQDELLHEIGVAALLHDSGKLFISKDILDKKDSLTDKEFSEIKKHPLRGAQYLAKMNNLTRLAPIIAFEHHLKYDGSGYPSVHLEGKKQHIFSQIVAIADFFDALRSRRPYRESMEIKDIFVLMKKNSGTDFNPVLVDNFIRNMEISCNKVWNPQT